MDIATSQEGASVNLDGLESHAIIVQGCPDAFMDLVSSHLSVDVRRVGQECFATSVSGWQILDFEKCYRSVSGN